MINMFYIVDSKYCRFRVVCDSKRVSDNFQSVRLEIWDRQSHWDSLSGNY